MLSSSLKILGAALPPYCLEDAEQTLQPSLLYGPRFCRTLDGTLHPLFSQDTPIKYSSRIRSTDRNFPGIAHLLMGEPVEVWTITALHQSTTPPRTSLQRPAVPSSLSLLKSTRERDALPTPETRIIETEFEGILTYFPILSMMITDFSFDQNEWNGKSKWEMTLEEI